MCCERRKRNANAHHDPGTLAMQRVLDDSQSVQASRRGRLRLAPPQTTSRDRRNGPARLKSDGLLDLAIVTGVLVRG
jgi:hypothetical protein